MNLNPFISLKIGEKLIFTHPLSQLKQISSIKKRTNNPKNNKRNFDVMPKFISNQVMKQDLSKKLLNKKNIFNKITNTYFSKDHPDFSEDLKNIENEVKFIQVSINKRNNNDYKKFGEMINIINNNKTNKEIQLMQKMNINQYNKMNNQIKNEILNSISLNKKVFIHKIGLNKMNPKLNQIIKSKTLNTSHIDLNNNIIIDNDNININNNNNFNNSNSEPSINDINNKTDSNINDINYNIGANKNDMKYNTEQKIKVNNNELIPISEEKIKLFKIFVGNSKLSNKIILSYFDSYNPKVRIAGEKYFKSKYGCEYITLNFVYPFNPPVNRLHNFNFISEINELFMSAQNDFPALINPKLFLENGKEIINNKKVKCIGALNLNNNSVIKVFKQ